MELVNSNSKKAEEGKATLELPVFPSISFAELVKHAISCQCEFGKCPVPGCIVTQKVACFLSPIAAKRRKRTETHIENKKRARTVVDIRKSGSHSTKRDDFIHVAPSKGDFTLMPVEYYLPRSSSYSPLLDTMTRNQLIVYIKYLKSRSLQTYYGPLIQLLMQHKDNHGIFNAPVDPDAENLPTYYSVISKPMDLGTIRDRLASGEYQTQRDILNDISLVFKNAQKFNPPNHFVYLCASSLSKVFESEVEKIRTRIEQNRVNQANHFCSSCRGTPCRICGEKCLKYSPPVFVCDGDCHERILRNTTYYIIRGQKGRYCQKCYAKKIVGMDKADRKNLFVKKKNDEVFPESWVQCCPGCSVRAVMSGSTASVDWFILAKSRTTTSARFACRKIREESRSLSRERLRFQLAR